MSLPFELFIGRGQLQNEAAAGKAFNLSCRAHEWRSPLNLGRLSTRIYLSKIRCQEGEGASTKWQSYLGKTCKACRKWVDIARTSREAVFPLAACRSQSTSPGNSSGAGMHLNRAVVVGNTRQNSVHKNRTWPRCGTFWQQRNANSQKGASYSKQRCANVFRLLSITF